MISVRDVFKQFGQFVAVNGVSFEVPEGATFGLLGPNGAGKTTLIRCLCGLLKPDKGTVWIDEQEDPMQSTVRTLLGVVPQSLAIYEELSPVQNLQCFGRLYGLEGALLKERVETCLAVAQLKDRAKDRVSTFSGGMKRRLNLACSLMHDPKVLLLDEPTVGVDPQSRNLIFDTIETMKAEGKTLIYTTHYMEEAQRLCDCVAIMEQGQIKAMDTVPALIQAHGGASRVEAVLKQDVTVTELKTCLKHESLCVDDQVLSFETQQPMEDLATLNAAGIALTSLKMENADLEDVFLNLTGRRLRDS